MSGLFGIVESAKKAINSSRVGMEVTGHNISNVNTPGYTRQRVELSSTDVLASKNGMVNAGVRVSGIKQIRDEFIEGEIRRVTNLVGGHSIAKEILSRIEALVNEPSDVGIGRLLQNFFNAFDDLAKNPEDRAVRVTVVQTGKALAQRFNDIFQSLLGMKKDVLSEIEAKLKNLNEIVAELGKLNKNAINLYNSGAETNDVRDKINQKLKELSKLVDIVISFDESGAVKVSVGGVTVVDKDFSVSFELKFVDSQAKIFTKGRISEEVKLTFGEIFALQNSFNELIPEIVEKFNQLALNLINKVNEIHRIGYGLDGTTGNDFFSGTGAGSIQVNRGILENLNKISASINGNAGNNEIALGIASLKNDDKITGFYNSIVSDIGLRSKMSSDNENLQQMILSQLESQRDAVSGVSIDEEMMNMIKFQKMFEASAKLIQTVNEMIDAVLAIVG
jgi:flagellar hook-associated protein 1 FlgK